MDNQSIGKDVWFDDIHVEHYTSKVLEEDHYYPFGLTVKLDHAARNNLPAQPYKYQGKELEKSFGIEMADFGARMYNPQLGIWHSPDPLADKNPYESPFVYAGNNPVAMVDRGGWYKVSAENQRAYQDKYPIIMNYLTTQAESDISGSTRIIDGLIKTNPNVKPETIKEISKWGQGPEIQLVAAPGEDGVFDPNAAGYTPKSANVIQLNSKYAEYAEKILENMSTEESKDVAFTRLLMTLIHETAHSLNTNGEVIDQDENGHYRYEYRDGGVYEGERGDYAEEQIWGPNYRPFTVPDPRTSGGVKNMSPEKYQPGVTEAVIEEAKRTTDGQKSLPTIR